MAIYQSYSFLIRMVEMNCVFKHFTDLQRFYTCEILFLIQTFKIPYKIVAECIKILETVNRHLQIQSFPLII